MSIKGFVIHKEFYPLVYNISKYCRTRKRSCLRWQRVPQEDLVGTSLCLPYTQADTLSAQKIDPNKKQILAEEDRVAGRHYCFLWPLNHVRVVKEEL